MTSLIPALFQPFTLRGLTLKNRIVVSPMSQYSANNGLANLWHVQHICSRVVGGCGLFMVESTGISEVGRGTPYCLGLYKDEHVNKLKEITNFAHEQGSHIGIQICHAGRKASTGKLWEAMGRRAVSNEDGGWSVVGPSPVAFSENYKIPQELTINQIKEIVEQFVSAAMRAVHAGFDVIEIHGAHGYLISSFLSPTSNFRMDEYGGSFQNRIRFLLDIVNGIRASIPKEMPLFVRLSCEEYMGDSGWTMKDTLKLAPILRDLGVDLLDCSSGGNNSQAKIHNFVNGLAQGYQVSFSESVKNQVENLATGVVGRIHDPGFANMLVEEQKADLVFVGRQELLDPYWPLKAAKKLNYNVGVPPQYSVA